MIRTEHLFFGYSRRREVFTDLSLRLDRGHIHGLLGCNGVGKSTLLKLFCGLLRAGRGRIEVDGADPARRSVGLLSRMVFLPEELELPSLTAARYARLNAPFYPDFSTEEFDRYCDAFETDRSVSLGRLSMGQRKKAYIAFALACNTPVLLLDEPTNGLDIPSKVTFRRLLANCATPDRTIVISTHQVREVENLIDYVTVCDAKGVVLSASTELLTRRLRFGAAGPRAFYTEPGLGGALGVEENRDGSESRLDLELLFNASVHCRDQVRTLINAKTDHDA